MEFDRLSFVSHRDADGNGHYSWRRTDVELTPDETISIVLPVGRNGNGGASRVELVVRANGSLEAIGRRITLFGRLLDEHGPPKVIDAYRRQQDKAS